MILLLIRANPFIFIVVQLQQEMASPQGNLLNANLEEKIKREAKQQCQKLQSLAMSGPQQVKGSLSED